MRYIQIKKQRSLHPDPLFHGKYMDKQWKQWQTLFSWTPKSLQMVTATMKLKKKTKHLLLGRKAMTNLASIFKVQRHYFANKGLSNQSHGLSSSHLWIWELDNKESWVLKNCGFWITGEDSWEFLGQQGDQISEFQRKSTLTVHWKDWYWSWSSNTLATWCKELTHWKRPWCW